MDFNINNYLSNLSTINKDFNSIWEEIITTVPKLTNKITPAEANESDPLIVLLKELGIISDKLNYNIDKNTLENFPDLLTQLRTAYSVFKSMGYNPNWYKSALTKITLIYNGGVDDVLSSQISSTGSKGFTLPRFTQVSDENNTDIYTLLESADFTPGEAKQVSLIAIEGTINDFEVNGDTQIKINNLDAQNKLYFVQPNIAQNGIFIDFNPEFSNIYLKLTGSNQLENDTSIDTQDNLRLWKRVDNLYQYLPGNYIYKFGIDPSTGTNYIQFPDDIGTLIDKGIYIKYILSSGEAGNIKAGTIAQLYNDPNISVTYRSNVSSSGDAAAATNEGTITKSNFTVRNLASTQNGQDPETIEEMQRNYERVVGTFDTLVTLRDYNNYIYNATDDAGRNLVSNIKVSDRGNDLYDYTPCRVYKATGIEDTINVTADVTAGNMNAYQLRLFPLKNTADGNINSWSDFNQTFTYSNIKGKLATFDSNAWLRQIEDSIKDVKSINHDFMGTCGAPVFVDYDISGQIYLQKVVSNSEALEIKQAIDLAIYRNFNSRELNFGEKINYPKLIEVIKNADPRIQYAAINPINYTGVELPQFNEVNNGYDITARSILKGTTPWAIQTDNKGTPISTGFDTFTYHYGQTETNFYGDANNPITSISPQVSEFHKRDITEDESGIEVYKNETYSILVPSYITQITYTNYLYVKVFGTEDGNDPKEGESKDPFILYKDNPVKLTGNQMVKIYETKDSYIYGYDPEQSNEKVTVDNPTYVLKADDIVLFASSDSKIKLSASDQTLTSMGTKLSISVLVPDENNIQNSKFISEEYADVTKYQIRIASNSSGLADYLTKTPSADGYTLNIGEYLLFADYNTDTDTADTPVLEVGIIGEGNTITNTTKSALLVNDPEGPQDPIPFNAVSNFIISTADITSGNFSDAKFVPINSKNLKYTANTIYNFGEGYLLKGITNPAEKPASTTQVFPITVQDDGIKYYKGTPNPDDGGYDYNTAATGTIPKPIDNEGYKMSCQLSLLLTPNNEQKLEEGQQVVLNGNPPLSLDKSNFTNINSTITDYSEEKIKGIKVTGFNGNDFMYLNEDKDISNQGGYIQMRVYNPNSFDIALSIGKKEDNSTQYIIKTKDIKQLLIPINSIIGTTNHNGEKIENLKNINGLIFSVLKAENSEVLSQDDSLIISIPIYIGGIIITETSTIQSNTTLVYSGGQALKLSETEQNTLRLMSYNTSDNTNVSTDIKWRSDLPVALPKLGDEARVEAFLVSYINAGNNLVSYVVADANADITINSDDKNNTTSAINKVTSVNSRILGILKGSKYYSKNNSSYEKISGLISSGENNYKELKDEDSLLYVYFDKPEPNKGDPPTLSYNPTYTSTSNAIINPNDPDSFFISTHPCNPYVIPRLIGKDGTMPLQELQISSLSIRS